MKARASHHYDGPRANAAEPPCWSQNDNAPPIQIHSQPPPHRHPPQHALPGTLRSALRAHWPLYLFEAIELALFMISACLFTVWLFHPDSLLPHLLPSPSARRALMGLAMGATAVLIIRSDIGKRSGAHFNPAITLTYLRLGKINPIDAHFYVLSHFAGGLFGVGLSTLLIGPRIATPSVNYAVTVPGLGGPPAAFFAELFMAALLMFTVLWVSNHPRLFPYTSYLVGTLIAFYILLFAPVSGSSINPARTFGSAVFARTYTSLWIYCTAPHSACSPPPSSISPVTATAFSPLASITNAATLRLAETLITTSTP